MGLANALLAALLAALALAAGRFSRRPALAHSLWVLVLLKLVTPPVVPLPVPGWRGSESAAAHAPTPTHEAIVYPIAQADVHAPPAPPAELPVPMNVEDV